MNEINITNPLKQFFPELCAVAESGKCHWSEAGKAYLTGLRRVTDLLETSAGHEVWASRWETMNYDLFEETATALSDARKMVDQMGAAPRADRQRIVRNAIFSACLWKFAGNGKLDFEQVRKRFHSAYIAQNGHERSFYKGEFSGMMTGEWMPRDLDLHALAAALGCTSVDLFPWLADASDPV